LQRDFYFDWIAFGPVDLVMGSNREFRATKYFASSSKTILPLAGSK